MHLAFRLSNHPLRVFEQGDDSDGNVIGLAIIGGARSKICDSLRLTNKR